MAGSYGYYDSDVTFGGRSDQLGYISAFRVSGQQGYPYDMTDWGVLPPHTTPFYSEDERQYKSYSGVTHLDYGNFSFDGFWSDYDAFALGVLPDWDNPHHTFRNKKLFLNAGYRIPVHDRATLELNATYNMQENCLSGGGPIIGTNSSDILGEATLFAEPTDNTNLVVGWLQEQRASYHPDDDRFQSITDYRHEPKAFYAQGDYKFDKFVKLIAGTQWNKSSYGSDDWISRLGLIITPSDNWGVKLLRGEAFRAPVTLETDLYDPSALVGNKNLEPETITTYDAQLFYHDKKTYAAATYFQSKIEKLIIYDTSVFPQTFMNGGVQRFWGIELEGKYFFTPGWHVLGSYLHQENEADAGISPTVVPENMFKLGTAYTWEWGTASLFYMLFGEPPHIDSALVVNPKPESINLLNLNVDLDISKNMGLAKGQSILTLRIENLLDEETYLPTFGYLGVPNSFPSGPGITWYVGVKLTF
jgi:outer membrane receptor protein involved in Fe transport